MFASEATGTLTTSSESTNSGLSGTVSAVVTAADLSTISTIVGTATGATSVTISSTGSATFNPSGDTRVTLPAGTVITSASGTSFDTTAIATTFATVSTFTDASLNAVAEVSFGLSSVGLNFSKPIRIDIPVSGITASTMSIRVKHPGSATFVTTGLTNDPNSTCTSGVSSVPSATATVSNFIATIYTCSASTFVATTPVVVTSSSSGGGGGGSLSIPLVTTLTTVANTGTTMTSKKKRIFVRKTPVKKTTGTDTSGVTETKAKTPVKVKKPLTRAEQVLAKNLYTNTPRVNLYLAADKKAKFLGYLTKNVKVSVLEENGDWIKVTTATFSGWANRAQFRLPSESEAANILRDADKVIPYVLYTNKGRVNVRSAGDKTAKFLGYFGSNTKVEVIGNAPEWLNITTKKLT